MSSNLIVSIFSVVKKLYVDGSSKYIRISEGFRVKLYFINETVLHFEKIIVEKFKTGKRIKLSEKGAALVDGLNLNF